MLDTLLFPSSPRNISLLLLKLEQEQNGEFIYKGPLIMPVTNVTYQRNRFNSEKICDISYANIYVKNHLKIFFYPFKLTSPLFLLKVKNV